MAVTQNTVVNNSIDLELIAEYQRLTEVESAIKKRKNEIKNVIKEYLDANGLKETPPYNGLVAVLEERTSYSLNPIIMEAALPSHVFMNIVNKEIDLGKVKREFLNENIPVRLLRAAEVVTKKEAFNIREANRNVESRRAIPFWRTESP